MKNKNYKWIVFWALLSVLIAIVVHVLFGIHPKNDFFVAKWTAGEILTYIGTISLGLLALWQNQKFKDENDRLQKQINELTEQSMEIYHSQK